MKKVVEMTEEDYLSGKERDNIITAEYVSNYSKNCMFIQGKSHQVSPPKLVLQEFSPPK